MNGIKEKFQKIIPGIPGWVMTFIDTMGRINLGSASAATAYYLVLSIVPMLIMIMAVLPFTHLTAKELVEMITAITPGFADAAVEKFVGAAYTQSVSLLSGSIIMVIWSASKGMLGLLNGLNGITGVKKEERSAVVIRIFALIYTVGLLAVIVLMLALLVFGDQIFELVRSLMPAWEPFFKGIYEYRVVLVIIPTMVLIDIMYVFIPIKRRSPISQAPGAVFCALGWAVFSELFSIYVSLFGATSVYGSLATPMFIIMWIYFCIYIFFLGEVLNETLVRNRELFEFRKTQ